MQGCWLDMSLLIGASLDRDVQLGPYSASVPLSPLFLFLSNGRSSPKKTTADRTSGDDVFCHARVDVLRAKKRPNKVVFIHLPTRSKSIHMSG